MQPPLAHILAVEDNDALAHLMRRILEPVGVELTIAVSGEQALELVRQRRFDLITLNIRLPGINGFEVCRRLKADPDLRAIPVIFASGETNQEFIDHAYQAGAVDYLTKPYGIVAFRERVLAQLHKL